VCCSVSQWIAFDKIRAVRAKNNRTWQCAALGWLAGWQAGWLPPLLPSQLSPPPLLLLLLLLTCNTFTHCTLNNCWECRAATKRQEEWQPLQRGASMDRQHQTTAL